MKIYIKPYAEILKTLDQGNKDPKTRIFFSHNMVSYCGRSHEINGERHGAKIGAVYVGPYIWAPSWFVVENPPIEVPTSW